MRRTVRQLTNHVADSLFDQRTDLCRLVPGGARHLLGTFAHTTLEVLVRCGQQRVCHREGFRTPVDLELELQPPRVDLPE